jgi:opacity protein-like surface antigen
MKRIVLGALTVITLLQGAALSAQTKKGLFFSINTGYNFRMSSMTGVVTNSEIVFFNGDFLQKQENISLSLGKGFQIGGAVGYMFNKNIGAELGINYLSGAKTEYKEANYDGTRFSNAISANMLQFRPTLVMALGMEKIDPYAKFGLLIGTGSIIDERIRTSGINTTKYKAIFDGSAAFGLQAALGLSYNLNANIALFGELNMVNLTYTPTKGKITEFIVNGVDQLSNVPTDIELYDSYGSSAPISIDPNTPIRQLKQSFPFGSFGFNFGVKYSL